MRGYLLDTMMIAFWHNPSLPEHEPTLRRIESLDPHSPLRISAVTWGEIQYGHRCVSGTETGVQTQFTQFVERSLPSVLEIRKTTAIYYGEIRARLFAKYAPQRGRRSLRPEQLVDPVTATVLGIQENDLWIAAQAIEHNLVLVTHDKLARLKDIASDLLEFEDWVV